MKLTRKLSGILLAGMLTICGALGVRQYTLKPHRSAPPPVVTDPTLLSLDARLHNLESAVAKSPQDPASHLALADFFQQLGRADKTAEQLEIVATLEPSTPYAHIALGNARLALMHSKEAESAFRLVTQRWPRNVQAWQGLATALYHQHRFMEAAAACRKAIAIDHMEPNGRYILACCLLDYALQFPDPAEHPEALTEARDNFRLVLGSWSEKGDVYYRLGRASMELRDKRQAIKNLRRAIELLPDRPEIPWQLAQAYNMMGDKAAARKVLEEAIVNHPKYPGLHDMLGKLLLTSGEPTADQTAFEHFRIAVQLAPGVPAFQERYGSACLRLNRLEEARKAFETAQQLDPNRIHPYQQLSAVYTRLGDTRKASLAARAAVEMTFNDQQLKRLMALSSANPNNARLHLILADRYKQTKMPDAARDELLMILKRDPKNPVAVKALAQLAAMPTPSPFPK